MHFSQTLGCWLWIVRLENFQCGLNKKTGRLVDRYRYEFAVVVRTLLFSPISIAWGEGLFALISEFFIIAGNNDGTLNLIWQSCTIFKYKFTRSKLVVHSFSRTKVKLLRDTFYQMIFGYVKHPLPTSLWNLVFFCFISNARKLTWSGATSYPCVDLFQLTKVCQNFSL